MQYLIYVLLSIIGMFILMTFVFKRIKKGISILEIVTVNAYFFSIILMTIGLIIHDNQYYSAIDPVNDNCYIPFGEKHIITLIFYFCFFNISVILIWLKGDKLPPLAKVLSLSFFIIGVVLNLFVLLQISSHNMEDYYMYTDTSEHILFLIFSPIMSIIISLILTIHIVKNQMMSSTEKTYSNKFLNMLNQYLAKKNNISVWSIILLIPLLLLTTIILILFGQDSNSLIKVFTETATWRFSQHIPPPVLDHNGHYLCTVAVKGSPKIVKPIRLGKRHGETIIVNRQLLIANAFEEMIENASPILHRLIRSNYDKYGFNLSKRINTVQMSNLTYILMKPLEWMFLICLYLFCEKPEERIKKQYTL